jgi:hypothetical protein
MKSATDFVKALDRGLGPEAALASLAPYELEYYFRIPVEIHFAAKELGWHFFPESRLSRSNKPNSLIRWATCNVEQLKRWAHQRPNWVLATGPVSGVFALEVDGNDGGASLLGLCGDDWDWLATFRTMAGSRRYIFFEWPEGWRQNCGSRPIGSGLRLIGDGGSLLVPPSREKGCYHVCISRQPVAPAPAWLLEAQFEPMFGAVTSCPLAGCASNSARSRSSAGW